jgi:hypothetical protein
MSEQAEPRKMLVRVPSDLRAWIELEAERNLSSFASEIIRSVRYRMESEQQRAAG